MRARNQDGLAKLRLFQLISPSLPIGSFAYSQGIEWAVELGWIADSKSLATWLESILLDSLVWLDLPVLLRMQAALETHNKKAFFDWSQQLLSSRETKELREEELNRARALLTVLSKLPGASDWPALLSWREALLQTHAAGFALASHRWGIKPKDMLNGYVWSWLESAVMAAIKLIPLGQSDGQAVLYQLTEKLPETIDKAMKVSDDEIGASSTALAIASSLHETQYTRLFRS
ncbi:MAG TPA: urease accessory protein UreF [Gammaproteobacteria bacterium]|nr:urease accessory protein UreF [Gammaproteobacteria bacterium]